ncbi:MAG: hypothetical protein H0T57_11580 [Rubrobacter sp.]|nr:hypothetical protein [Rubrobacter sp.]
MKIAEIKRLKELAEFREKYEDTAYRERARIRELEKEIARVRELNRHGFTEEDQAAYDALVKQMED